MLVFICILYRAVIWSKFNPWYQQKHVTCPIFIVNKTFLSNVTKKIYTIINHSGENISCHTSNLIYLLICSTCNIYMWEKAVPLHKSPPKIKIWLSIYDQAFSE